MSEYLPLRAPHTDAQWARDTEKRLRLLENAKALRVGPWVLSTVGGNLVATSIAGDTINLSLPPVVVSETGGPDRGFTLTDEVKEELAQEAEAKTVADLLDQLTGIPGGGIDALGALMRQFLYGQIAPERIPSVPVNSIGAATKNLLYAPTFATSRALDGKGLWFFDATTGRTSPGSTYTDLNGVDQRTLWSNEIYVAPGDILDMDIYTRRENYVGPSDAIGIDVVAFNGEDPVANLVSVTTIDNSDVVATSANMVIDPACENTAINRYQWIKQPGEFSYSTEHFHSGSRSIKIISGTVPAADGEADGTWNGFSFASASGMGGDLPDATIYTVQPGQRFYVQLWVYPMSNGSYLDFGAEVRDSTGVITTPQSIRFSPDMVDYNQTSVTGNPGDRPYWVWPMPPAHRWTRLSGYITIPAGYDRMSVWCEHGGTPPGTTIFCDDMMLMAATTASSPNWDENLAGSWTAPTGVDRMRLQLRVDKAGSAGRVRFDDGTVTKRGTTIPQRLVDHLPEDIRGIVQGIGSGATSIIKDLDQFDIPSIREVVNNLLRGVTDANAAIAELVAIGSAVQQGRKAIIKFGDYPNGPIPSDFREIVNTGSGGVVIRDGCMDWSDSGNQRAVRMYLYDPLELATDIFEVAIAMPRRCEGNLLFGVAAQPCYNYLIGGSNAAGTEFSVVRVGYDTVRFGWASGGNINWFGADYGFQTPAGSSVRLRGEVVGGAPTLELYVNSHRVTGVSDPSILIDGSHRKCGLGFQANTRALGQNTPGSVSLFLMNDASASGPPLET